MNLRKSIFLSVFISSISFFASAQLVTDPLPYAPIANPLSDTLDQLIRDSVNLKFSPIRINQAGYRPQDKKYFYYVGTGGTTFSVINQAGASVGTGTLKSTGQTASGQLKIKASNNATLVSGGDTRYQLTSSTFSGPISEGLIPDLPPGVYKVVVGTATSHPFIIDERVYSYARDALLKFYGVNRCGDSQSWFHKPCHLKDAVTGGWHDCGDHLKEGATMSYAAAVLGLAAAAFFDRDVDVYSANQGITQITDGIPDILYEAKHGADFILQSYDKAGGKPVSMVTSIGGFGNTGCGDDHSWWGQPENQDKMPAARGGPPRCARVEIFADYMGKYAANLAFVSKRMKPYDAAYADRCIKAAAAIYEHSKSYLKNTNVAAYNGGTIVSDDMAFGCLALLWATGDKKYLNELCFDKAIGVKANTPASQWPKLFNGGWFTHNDPLFTKTSANTDWASCQSHVLWGFFKLILNDSTMCEKLDITPLLRDTLIEKTVTNLVVNLSSIGQGTQTIPLPDNGVWVQPIIKYGLPWFTMQTQMEWVWNRYQSGNITEMYYYYDIASKIQGLKLPNTPASADWKPDSVKTVLVRMLDYMFGVNPWDISMVYGVGEKNFNHPHHRAANPEGKNVPGAFYKYRPPVGALQGGYMPTTSLYSEHYDDYMHSETGIDGTTNLLMPVIGLAKEDTVTAPTGTVRIIYVGCTEAIIEVRQSRYGKAVVHYGPGVAFDKLKQSDSSDVLHRIVLDNLTRGTVYSFDVQVTDVFGRSSTLKYLNEDKQYVNFTFTTLQTCPTNAEISNVKVCKVTSDSAEIFWYTPNGNFDSKVVYGTQKPPTTVQDGDISGHPVKFHYVKIGGLKEKTTYYFYVESGESRDDNSGQLYTFTTPVEHVEFDVRTLRYNWGTQPGVGLNIVNQDVKSYDSLELRLYFRDKEGFEKDLGARIDIMVLYREDGFQDTIGGALRTAIWKNLATQKPTQIPDTYDPVDNTYAYYFSIPLWGIEMRSQSRIRLDIIFDRWEQTRLQDLLGMAPLHQITSRDWSFGPHSKANGEPVDYPGMPILPKEDVDASYFLQPVNHYVTIYRKNEYVWGYSPSQAELKTKKTQYQLSTQVTSPLNNPSADYVFIEKQARTVDVSGWAKLEPADGSINDIWVNGVKIANPQQKAVWSEADKRYNFTIPVPVQNGRNNVDLTLFAGPSRQCTECYGCAVSNHSFYIEFQGAKQYPSTLVLRDGIDQTVPDTVRLDTTQFNVILTDRNGNVNAKAPDLVLVKVKNLDNNDSLSLYVSETGDSTGIFKTAIPIAVVDKTPDQTGQNQIAMNGGDRVRIWYIDATDETDSAEVFIYSKASFPLARRGYLKDSNGDGSADILNVEYSIPLKQNPDSLSVNFPASTTSVTIKPSSALFTFTGNLLSIVPANQFTNGITGFSSSLYTSGTSFLTNTGLIKSTKFLVYDSIGPVLNNQVIATERTTPGNDTITLTTSEAIGINSLTGEILSLKKNGVAFPVNVKAILGIESGTNTVRLLVDAKGQGFATGDSLCLNASSALTDISGNKPHPDNRRVPVIIKAAIPSAKYAFYKDTDCNGKFDIVTIGFTKPVDPASTSISLKLSNAPFKPITSQQITSSAPDELKISLNEEFTGDQIATAGLMTAKVVFSNAPKDTVTSDVADSVTPLIQAAVFRLSPALTNNSYIDTLEVTFTEQIKSIESLSRFNLHSTVANKAYSFIILEKQVISSDKARFTGTIDGVEFPNSGDKISLVGGVTVSDFRENHFICDINYQAPVTVAEYRLSLKDILITKGPNPFSPAGNQVFKVKIEPISRFPIQLDSAASTIIYDKVGNIVAKPLSQKTLKGIELTWDGTNKKGRRVGKGSYLMVLYFKGEQENIMIAVDQ